MKLRLDKFPGDVTSKVSRIKINLINWAGNIYCSPFPLPHSLLRVPFEAKYNIKSGYFGYYNNLFEHYSNKTAWKRILVTTSGKKILLRSSKVSKSKID